MTSDPTKPLCVKDYVTCGFRNEWRYLFDPTYCTTFTVIVLEFERDRMCGTLEIEFRLLGIGLWISIAVAPPSNELLDAIKEITELKP